VAAALLAQARAVERLREALRDAARLDLAATRRALDAAERTAGAAADDLGAALGGWNAALARRRPDPGLFGLAGAEVVRAEARRKAALLDEKIAHQRCAEAVEGLARADARLEGARMVGRAARRDHDRAREEQAAREAEDAFIRRRRA